MKTVLYLSPLMFAGCTAGGPDMSPIGGGLAVVGLSIILAAFVLRLIK